MASTLAAQGIESNELALDLILHDLAEQARQATNAAGAAIALQRDRAMVCRAAAGAVAPDLGVAINTESGLTGACVREQKTQWCSDTETDPRVDAEACRALGVRSIVVVPVFRRDALVGVFEIFAAEPQAFEEHHLKALQGLAQWVTEAMQSAAGKTAVRQIPEPLADVFHEPDAEQSARKIAQIVPISQSSALATGPTDKETKILRAVVIGLAIILVLMLGIHWGWKGTKVQEAARTAPAANPSKSQAAPSQPEEITLQGFGTSAKPAASKTKPASDGNTDSLVVYRDGNVVYRQKPAEASSKSQATGEKSGKDQAESQTAESDNGAGPNDSKPDAVPDLPPPQITTTAGLLAMVPSPGVAAAPTAPAVRISEGLTEGKLVHRVNPIYPSQALQRRIDGQVVIRAQVGKDGRVHNPKAVRGNALLIAAALDAVRQWTYEPYKLNGDPVDMDTQITINFKLP
jgi:TonB family protein